jgi:hypothetical protein
METLRRVIGDAYTAIRSDEANKALATVSLEQLIGDQILRNGDSARSNASQFDPYSLDPNKDQPASTENIVRANTPSGADTQRPTKLDRVLAIVNQFDAVVEKIKELSPTEVAEYEEYSDQADSTF